MVLTLPGHNLNYCVQVHRHGHVLLLGKELETYSLIMWCVMVMN